MLKVDIEELLRDLEIDKIDGQSVIVSVRSLLSQRKKLQEGER